MSLLQAAASNLRLFAVLSALVAILGVTIGVGITAASVFAVHDDPEVHHACYSRISGAMRYVVDPSDCTRYEQSIDWNQQGVEGQQGPPGPAGQDAPPQVAGRVNADGTILAGSGFTSSFNPSTDDYTITFPAGTWDADFAFAVFQSTNFAPVDSVHIESRNFNSVDGSGQIVVDFANPVDPAFGFDFTATQVTPASP